LRLFEIEHEPITVVVVPGIVVIKLRRFRALVGRAERFAIPVGNDVNAVRVGRRDEQEDRVLQNLARLRVFGGGQFVSELHGHLRGDDLGRMNRTGDDDHGFPFAQQRIAFRLALHEARVGQPPLDVLVPGEIAYILWRADEGDNERAAQSRLSDGA
jgi:hypothetical protein